jgi:putative membrane protein insertion efficiency factor
VTAASQPSLLSRLLLLLIRLYQLTLSRLLPVVSLGTCACRFSPTCSCYAAEALRLHGAPRGLLLAVRRLLRCTPLHPGGFDPVPPPRPRPAPVCRAATSA